MIKLIAIDLDGTLLNSKKKISSENKETLLKAKSKGIKIVLCTGRPLASIFLYLEELNLTSKEDYTIVLNGALVQCNYNSQIISKSFLSIHDIFYLSTILKKLRLPLDILSDSTVLQLKLNSKYSSIYSKLNPLLSFKNCTLSDIHKKDTYNKVIVACSQEYLDEQISKIPPTVYKRFEVFKTHRNLLEFMPKGIDKLYGIKVLMKQLNIFNSEVMCIGNEENDLSMIKNAGLGVAMGNAIPSVKNVANIVTSSNDENGVSKVIQEYVLK